MPKGSGLCFATEVYLGFELVDRCQHLDRAEVRECEAVIGDLSISKPLEIRTRKRLRSQKLKCFRRIGWVSGTEFATT